MWSGNLSTSCPISSFHFSKSTSSVVRDDNWSESIGVECSRAPRTADSSTFASPPCFSRDRVRSTAEECMATSRSFEDRLSTRLSSAPPPRSPSTTLSRLKILAIFSATVLVMGTFTSLPFPRRKAPRIDRIGFEN